MAVDWTHELVEQLDFYWQHMFMPRLDGLTDEEFFWEPVDGCWTIRPDGGGGWTIDWQYPEPTPPPVTTIAWRIGHIGSGVLGIRASDHFGDQSLSYATITWPGSAAEGIAFLQKHYAAWKEGVAAMSAEELAAPCGPAEGPHRDHPMATLVLHINREVIHHAAEVALLRDLYRERVRT